MKPKGDNTLRLLNKFTIGDDCWEWTAYVAPSGYGRDGQYWAHRRVYEEFVGPIPEGLQLDHLCRNRSCVRPAHLEPVTAWENGRRSTAWHPETYAKRKKSQCPRGHQYTEENTYTYPDGRTKCRTCSRAQDNSRNRRKREARG